MPEIYTAVPLLGGGGIGADTSSSSPPSSDDGRFPCCRNLRINKVAKYTIIGILLLTPIAVPLIIYAVRHHRTSHHNLKASLLVGGSLEGTGYSGMDGANADVSTTPSSHAPDEGRKLHGLRGFEGGSESNSIEDYPNVVVHEIVVVKKPSSTRRLERTTTGHLGSDGLKMSTTHSSSEESSFRSSVDFPAMEGDMMEMMRETHNMMEAFMADWDALVGMSSLDSFFAGSLSGFEPPTEILPAAKATLARSVEDPTRVHEHLGELGRKRDVERLPELVGPSDEILKVL